MLNKLAVLILAIIGYICMRKNNKQSEYKIKISSKIIRLIIPLLDKQSNGSWGMAKEWRESNNR